MIPVGEPEIKREDSTPSVIEQARGRGWEADFYNFGLAERDDVTYFNPGLVERPDGLWLLVRRSENAGTIFGRNNIWAFMLDEEGKVPKRGDLLVWPESLGGQQYEDGRAAYHARLNQTWIGACTFIWYETGEWTGAHQVVGAFDNEWNCKIKHDPIIGGNAGYLDKIEVKNYEKSWLWFFANDKLHLLYKSRPWIIAEFGESWEESVVHRDEKGVSWKFGEIRGGTPPVLVDGLFYTFFHSSLPWQGNYRRYYAGCIAFESEPPYRPVKITPEPMLAGSQNDPWFQRKPPCIFPCGAVLRNDKWLISAGVNDLKCAWFEIPHSDVLSLLKPIEKGVTPIIPPTGLSKEEQRLNVLRANATKARAAKKGKCLDCDKLAKWKWVDGIILCEEHSEHRKERDRALPYPEPIERAISAGGHGDNKTLGSNISPVVRTSDVLPKPASRMPEEKLKKLRANAAKARAVLAEKRKNNLRVK